MEARAWAFDRKLPFDLLLSAAGIIFVPKQLMSFTKVIAPTLALEQLALESGTYSCFRRDARIRTPAFAAVQTVALANL